MPFLSFSPMLRRVIYTTNSIESLNYRLRKVTQEPGPLPLRHGCRQAAVAGDLQALRTGVLDSGTKRKGLPADKRKAPGRLIEGATTTNWKQALQQLALAYPERINPHL